jgi:hypothetical protein
MVGRRLDLKGWQARPTTAMRVKAFEPNKWLLWQHQGCPWV